MVVWIIGLSGSGKTTLANEIVQLVRKSMSNIALVDGDVVREMFGSDLGHTLADRRRNADRICGLCKFLDDQKIHVVCAILSIFPESRAWNRTHIRSYYEVFIDAPLESLVARDSKGLYRRAMNGELANVAGVDLDFPHPEAPDLVIRNDRMVGDLLSYAPNIASRILNS